MWLDLKQNLSWDLQMNSPDINVLFCNPVAAPLRGRSASNLLNHSSRTTAGCAAHEPVWRWGRRSMCEQQLNESLGFRWREEAGFLRLDLRGCSEKPRRGGEVVRRGVGEAGRWCGISGVSVSRKEPKGSSCPAGINTLQISI